MSEQEANSNPYDPSYHDVFADALPPPTVVDSGGRRWTIGFPTQVAKGIFERLLIDQERELIQSQKGLRTKDEYESRWDQLANQVKAKAFAVGGPLWLKHATGTTGMGWLLWVQSLVAVHHPDVTTEQVVKLASEQSGEVKVALNLVVPPFFAWVLSLAERLAETPGNEKLKPEIAKIRAALPSILAQLLGQPTPT